MRHMDNDLVRMLTFRINERQILSAIRPESVEVFQAIQAISLYPRGATLFVEGGHAEGIFVLREGGVQLSIPNVGDGVLSSRRARAGEVLGLSAAVSGKRYQMTAETTTPSRLSFIRREDLLRFLHEHADAAFRVVELLSDKARMTSEVIRSSVPFRRRRPQVLLRG